MDITQLRQDLAACYRLVAHYGWDDMVFTHISARIPGTDGEFLINPYGMLFDEINASSLIRIDQNGNKLDDSPYPVNPAGFCIHSAVHTARKDAHCVIHLHPAAGVAVAAQQEGLLPISQHAMFVLSSLSYHDYEGLALTAEEQERLQQDLGDTHCMILRNHGLLTCAATVADAFHYMYFLQRACEIQIQAQSSPKLKLIDDSVLETVTGQAPTSLMGNPGKLIWPGLLRQLDRTCPGYKD